ncbi:metallophosphoesterase [bacterium]|nr:metallophosphoesterase [bacterium]RQV94843.1 MAG: hypothetical protein EH221_07000 [bacterium]
MSTINSAIALSDLHLGKETGYLYSKHPEYRQNRTTVLDLLQSIGPQDELILAGDFLELSLAGHDAIYSEIKAFFSLIAETGPYKRIVFIPGNHDHHFWRRLGEQIYIDGKIRQGLDPPDHETYPFCFVDERFSSQDPNLPCKIILEELWPKEKPKPEFVVKYPHHLIKVIHKDKAEYYLFTHGHFLEDLFKPVNYLIEPAHIEELEAFNNVWLEAFDYHIGHAGRLSKRVRELIRSFEEGGQKAKQTVNAVLNEIYLNLKEMLKLSWIKASLTKLGLKYLAKKIPEEPTSGLFKVVSVDQKLKKSIAKYIEKYILDRYQKGKAKAYHFPADKNIPTPFTFVFGHTHRPIRGKEIEKAEVTVKNKKYPLANTGGWLRTDGTGKANGENAGVLVIDQKGVRWETLEGKLR